MRGQGILDVARQFLNISRAESRRRRSCRPAPQAASFVNEFLNKIRHDHTALAIQMNTVGVKTPAIHAGDLIGTKNSCAHAGFILTQCLLEVKLTPMNLDKSRQSIPVKIAEPKWTKKKDSAAELKATAGE
jgi:hypothetical protein